jgi:CarboxypepD_reg-like domain
MSNCHCNTDIILDGSGQLGRYLKALDPAYAPIDDRSIEDLLLFAKRYAGQIRFYDIPGSNINDDVPPGKVNWREFFRRDMAVIAASVAVLDISNLKKEYDELRERLDADPSSEKLAAAFALSISMATRIDRWYTVAIPGNPLRTDLDLAINAHLRWQMKRIMAYEDGYKFIDSKNPLNLDYSGIQNDETWGLKDAVDPDATIYQGATPDDKLRNAALYADEIFNDFFSSLQNFIDRGPDYMSFALEQYPAHQPHMALFIAFLQIFKLAQEQMNGLTGRMLDFYYKEVLQLTPKDSIPDRTHVIFELAKDIVQYDIPAGTAFSAGKDASGKEQVYKSASDLVVNQAKVKELKTIFIDKKDPVAPKKTKTIRSIYASPVANSADGYGTAFTEANPKWPTFGKGMSANTGSANICKSIDAIKENLLTAPAVQTGFAIASPQLVLQGGKRLIALNVPGINAIVGNALTALSTNPLEIWLTSEKEWLKVDKVMPAADMGKFMQLFVLGHSVFHPETDEVETSYFIDAANDTIYVYLPIAEKAIVAYDAKLHTGYNYKTVYPVMQVMLNEDLRIDEEVYNTVKATNLSLEVRVGSINPSVTIRNELAEQYKIFIPDYNFDGLETVVIQNAEGLFPSDKPFNPFTQYPGPGKSLYIGSTEVFNKPLGKLAVCIKRTQQDVEQDNGIKDLKAEELKLKATTIDYNRPYGVSVLTNRSWKDVSTLLGTDFSQPDLTENILNLAQRNAAGGSSVITPLTLDRNPIEAVTEYKNQTAKGFIRIDYLLPLYTYGTSTMQASQELAPREEIKEISVNYHSVLTQLDSATDQLFHVYPFGVVETYFGTATAPVKSKALIKSSDTSFSALDKLKGNLLVNANNLLLPQYTFLDTYSAYTSSGKATAGSVSQFAKKRDILSNLVLASSGVREAVEGGNNQYSNKLQEQGMLFIGLEKAVPLQSLSLLFQFAEGSADDEDNDPPVIHWSYLTNNEWRPLRGEDIVSDGTYGFQTTGIVKLNIPADATNNNTIITEGLHWFSVSVSENAHRIPKLINVVTQAAEVVFEDNDNDQKHFDAALPAGSITKLAVKVAEVSKVEQPFASYDGKHKEISKEFYTRVSERLRHKGRAINSWDYEHLVLDRFPSIYKVKCITATDPNCLCRQEDASKKTRQVFGSFHFPDGMPQAQQAALLAEINSALKSNEELLIEVAFHSAVEYEITDAIKELFRKSFSKSFPGINFSRFSFVVSSEMAPDTTDAVLYFPIETACCGPQIAPGHVLLVPIANLKNRNSINPLQPKTSRRILLEIEAYLKKLTSPFVKVHAKNPVYEQVIVGFRVQFYTGTDKGFYLKKLNEEIVQYLTPWAFDENADVQFGQKIYASSIINFIEERPYVDFITDFVMGVCKDECCKPVAAATRQIQPVREAAEAAAIKTTGIKMEKTAVLEHISRNAMFTNMKMAAPAAAIAKARGVVFDEKKGTTIVGAKVTVKGTTTSVSTSADGSFTLALDPDTAVLVVEAVGYKTAEIAAAGATEFKIGMTAGKDAAKLTGVVTDAKTGLAIPGATVAVKGTAMSVSTAINGSFAVEANTATAVLIVSAVGYSAVEVAAGGLTELKVELKPITETLGEVVVVTADRESIAEKLAGICGCSDLETAIGEGAATKGEIVARPSTARSILVSVPQHVIIPYTAPVKETPCEVRKKNKPAPAAEAVPPPPPVAEVKPKPAPPVAEAPKGNVKGNVPPAKDEVKAGTGTITAEPVKPGKDIPGLKDIKGVDLVKLNPLIKAEELDVKKPLDSIKDDLVTGITKAADTIKAEPVVKAGDMVIEKPGEISKGELASDIKKTTGLLTGVSVAGKALQPEELIKAGVTGIKAVTGTKAAGTVKEKLTVPAKAAKQVTKPVKKAAPAKPKKNK